MSTLAVILVLQSLRQRRRGWDMGSTTMKMAARPAFERLVRIDEELRRGRPLTASGLAALLEVHVKTVRRDLQFLRDRLGAPVEYDGAARGFRYAHSHFRLPTLPLTEGELVSLFLAERLLRQYRGTPFEEDLTRAFDKIVRGLDDVVSVELSRAAEAISVAPTVLAIQDLEIFRGVAAAIRRGQVLEIDYWSASRGEQSVRRVDPYQLALVEHDWYLIGRCHIHDDTRMFATLRIASARPLSEPFARPRPADFSLQEYLGSSFRALRGERELDVSVVFKASAARRVSEKVWHASQVLETLPDQRLRLRVRVSDLREISRFVQWWGADIDRIEEPAELRALVAEAASALAAAVLLARQEDNA